MKSCCKDSIPQDMKKPQEHAAGADSPEPRNRRMIRWFKRLGVAGFLFFLGKGLIWIAVLYGGFRFAGCDGG